jgi:hypothetical protein
MHLSPGVPVVALYLGGGRWLADRGQPADLAMAAGVLFFMFPIELLRTLHAGRRATGRWGFEGGVLFRAAMGPRRFLARAAVLTVAAFALLFLTLPLTSALAGGPFRFMPDFMGPDYNWTTLALPRWWLLIVGVLLIAVNGLLAPWVEEVYYRGYLLQRMPGRPVANVVASGALFAVEHLWQPQNWPLIAALGIMLGFVALRWRNIWVGYAVHAFANTFGILILVVELMRR